MNTRFEYLTLLTLVLSLLFIFTMPNASLAATNYNASMGSPSGSNSGSDLNSLMGGDTNSGSDLNAYMGSPAGSGGSGNGGSYQLDGSLQSYILAFGYFINGVLIPFLFALGLLFFLYNTARYFIIKADDASAREQARKQALYGIMAFVFLVSIWGIVNMFIYSLDLYNEAPINSDYVENGETGNGGYGGWFNGWLNGSNSTNNDPNSYMGSPAKNSYTDFFSI